MAAVALERLLDLERQLVELPESVTRDLNRQRPARLAEMIAGQLQRDEVVT